MAKYQIWDKQSTVITPSGEVFTPEQWIFKHPMAGIEGIKTVLGGGVINGAYFGELTSMVEIYSKEGCDFSNCESDQDYLDTIEAFEDQMNSIENDSVSTEELTATSLASIAASLEYQNMMTLDDVDEEEEI